MFWQLAAPWIALVLAPIANSYPAVQDAGAPLRQMRPITMRNYEAAFGLQRRNTEQLLSSLSLQNETQLMYGNALENEDLLVANMTLYAPNGMLMILMEEFAGLTSGVNCDGDSGTISLTFKTQQAFDTALQTWKFINDNDDDRFLLIANDPGCSPEDQRQPYLITGITEDTAQLTTYLKSQPAVWSEVARTFDLVIGKAIAFPPSQNTKRSLGSIFRGIKSGVSSIAHKVESGVDSIAHKVESAGETVASDVASVASGSISKAVNLPLSWGTPNNTTSIVNSTAWKLDCINCYIVGSMQISGHIAIKDLVPSALSISGNPVGFSAAAVFEATIEKPIGMQVLSYNKTLFSLPVPDAGIYIPHIFTLGAIMTFGVGASVRFTGAAAVDFGLEVAVPDSAQFNLDLVNTDAATADGWSGSATPKFDVKALDASLTLAAYAVPAISFEFSILEEASASATLGIKLPQVSTELTAAYNQSGVCTPGGLTTGAELASNISVELDFSFTATIAKIQPSYSKVLWSYVHALESLCLPVNIPGLSSKASSTSSPAAVSLLSGPVASGAVASGLAAPSGSGSPIFYPPYHPQLRPHHVVLPAAQVLPGASGAVQVPSGFFGPSGASPVPGNTFVIGPSGIQPIAPGVTFPSSNGLPSLQPIYIPVPTTLATIQMGSAVGSGSAMPSSAPAALPTQDPAALPTQDPDALPTQDPAALPTQDPDALPTQDLL